MLDKTKAHAAPAITRCRLSGSTNLHTVLQLGEQALTGVFPQPGQTVTSGPLDLVWCPDSGLLQLGHNYPAEEMYGDNYGYRSGLNASMAKHLSRKAAYLARLVELRATDVVVDIGSNDGTLLNSYPTPDILRIGIDPTAVKFRDYYDDAVVVIPDFFTASAYGDLVCKRAKIITSIAMFYDLDDPVLFAREVASILSPDGVWHFEQSYLPSMLRSCAYDTVCHEHVEYYSLGVVRKILSLAGLEIVDVQTNSVNGGSFAVTAAHPGRFRRNDAVVHWMLEQEERMGLDTIAPYRAFEERVMRHACELRMLLASLKASGKKILGYGASTKGNVMLQYCGIGTDTLDAIADVNPDKWGCVTPGTNIPIIGEEEAHAMRPDYFLVLPWHFKPAIIEREQAYLAGGGKMIFPLPEIEII